MTSPQSANKYYYAIDGVNSDLYHTGYTTDLIGAARMPAVYMKMWFSSPYVFSLSFQHRGICNCEKYVRLMRLASGLASRLATVALSQLPSFQYNTPPNAHHVVAQIPIEGVVSQLVNKINNRVWILVTF